MVLFHAGISGEFSDVEGSLGLQVVVDFTVILTSAVVVEVYVLIDVLYTIASHFKHWQHKGLVIGGLDPAPVAVLHVFLLDLEEDADGEGAHVSEFLSNEAVEFVFDLAESVCAGVALLEVVFVQLPVEMVGVGKAWLSALVDSVEQLEDLLA